MVNPKRKGNSGEREFAKIINKIFNVKYARTPNSGGLNIKADIRRTYLSRKSRVDDFHWEVKRQEKLNIYNAINQAIQDARLLVPVVAHRRNNGDWLITMKAEDLLNLVKELDDLSSV